MTPLEIQGLLRPSAYPHPVGEIRLRETHVSWVVLTGSYTYKLKKPVKLEFLDMTSLDRRRTLCEEEIRLNRRLAADLYLEVVTINRDSQGLHVGGAGTVVDYAVRMRQFDASEELPALLARRDVGYPEMAALGERLAEFHESAPHAGRDIDFDYRSQSSQSVLGNLATLISHLPAGATVPELGPLIDWTHDTLHDLLPVMTERQTHGFVRECHGDLHAANVVRWKGRLTPFDCLEFDPRLRFIDIMSDIAFLYMDLRSYQRKDLAAQLLSSYLEATGDYAGVRELPFYGVYRALVRAMVDALSAEQRPSEADALTGRLLARLHTAMELSQPSTPTLYLMHGASGSGKSWLSERLLPILGAIRMRSDVERKRRSSSSIAGKRSGEGPDLYSSEMRERTYRHLRDCAEALLAAGVSTIVDASFLDLSDRQAFRSLAAGLRVDCRIIACTAGREEMVRRLQARSPRDPSDADAAVLEHQLRRMEPLAPDEELSVIRVDTTAYDWESRFRAQMEAPRLRATP